MNRTKPSENNLILQILKDYYLSTTRPRFIKGRDERVSPNNGILAYLTSLVDRRVRKKQIALF